jgi:hydroxyethylthiazole kinase-like uncharacterized protein yjeF
MEKLVSVAEMQSIEREANDVGLSYSTMMENAGTSLAFFVDNVFGGICPRSVFALVGSGNNGGDALVALCKLAELHWQTKAYIVKRRPEWDEQLQRYIRYGGTILYSDQDEERLYLNKCLTDSPVLIDGILGTGVRYPLPVEIAHVMVAVNHFLREKKTDVHVVAVDCPSGVDCDTGNAAPEVIPAEITYTMAAIKRGLLKFPAADLMGEIFVGDIGNVSELTNWINVKRGVLTELDISLSMPPRPRNAHKGTFGTVFVVAGSGNYPGAVLLSGLAAYRIGAGLVKIAIPELIFPALVGELKEATWLRLPHRMGWISEDAYLLVEEALPGATALLIGPGMGLENTTGEFIKKLISANLPKTVFDADGLKLLAKIPDWHSILSEEVVLTPHPGEMAVLTGLSREDIQLNRLELAEDYACQWRKVVVLKGAYTVIAEPGGATAVVPIATPALARAGTGDVLAGLITGLLAQGLDPFHAACTGAYIHGRAGLLAEKEQGNSNSVLAGDVLDMVPKVLAKIIAG